MRSLAANRPALIAAVAAVNLLFAGAGWFLLVSPQRQHAASAAQQATKARDELSRLASSPSGATPQRPQIKTADLYRLAEAMPTTVDEPDLLLALDQLANASGVRVLGESPQAPTAAAGYSVLPITLNLSGSYGSLTHFLHRLRGLVSVRHGKLVATGRLFSVSGVSMTPGTGDKLTADVSVQAYTFGTAPGATSTGTTGTGTTTTSTTTSSSG